MQSPCWSGSIPVPCWRTALMKRESSLTAHRLASPGPVPGTADKAVEGKSPTTHRPIGRVRTALAGTPPLRAQESLSTPKANRVVDRAGPWVSHTCRNQGVNESDLQRPASIETR